MIMPDEMQCAMDDQQCELVGQRLGSTLGHLGADDDVTDHCRLSGGHRPLSVDRERKHVGWTVPIHVPAIQLGHLGGVHEGQADLGGPSNASVVESGDEQPAQAVGVDLAIVLPVVDLHGDDADTGRGRNGFVAHDLRWSLRASSAAS